MTCGGRSGRAFCRVTESFILIACIGRRTLAKLGVPSQTTRDTTTATTHANRINYNMILRLVTMLATTAAAVEPLPKSDDVLGKGRNLAATASPYVHENDMRVGPRGEKPVEPRPPRGHGAAGSRRRRAAAA